MTRPLCWLDGQPLWECHLYNDDSGDTCDKRPTSVSLVSSNM